MTLSVQVSAVDSVLCVLHGANCPRVVTQTVPWFNCTSSMLTNVQLGNTCVRVCGTFLNCRNTDMFHTCTRMTWTHCIINTQGQMDLLNLDLICMLNTFFFSFFLHFSFFSLNYSPFLFDQFSFGKLLSCIRQKREFLQKGGSSSKSNWIQLDLWSTDEEWKACRSLTMTGAALL